MKIIEEISDYLKVILVFSSIALGSCICMWYIAVLFDFGSMYSTKEIYSQGNYSMAEVVDYKIYRGEGGPKYYPIVRYQVGTEIYEDYKIKFDGKYLAIGEEVLIYTDANKPQNFMIARAEYYDSIEMFWWYTIILIIGIIMIVGPIMVIRFIEKKESTKREYIKKKKKIKMK